MHDRTAASTARFPTADMLAFLEPATLPIETLTPSAWGGHIPFLFCLMPFLRPRAYVELGTHYGASFFAACQAIRHFGVSCRATAVDLWEGDEHAGFYGETVHASFLRVLRARHAAVGQALRMRFDDAVPRFADGSIDLLHIDGLHTYEAVRNDYTRWLPKVSPHGVILFHDTTVRERGFGVWRFWDEIAAAHASFNFTHTHGLGVIALGGPGADLLAEINRTPETAAAFDRFFTRAGERAVATARSGRAYRPRRFPTLKRVRRAFQVLADAA